jgi:hypothetical protein
MIKAVTVVLPVPPLPATAMVIGMTNSSSNSITKSRVF